jgi:retinol dehydrogenase-12
LRLISHLLNTSIRHSYRWSTTPATLSPAEELTNQSLGYANVVHFAKANASRIIIASRDITRIQKAITQVYKDVPSYRGSIEAMQLDLADFDNVRAFAKAINDDERGRLDVVVANAGIMKAKFSTTKDGHESVMQVNGLATGLMAVLLLPKLEKTAGMPAPEKSKGMKPSMTIVASDGE